MKKLYLVLLFLTAVLLLCSCGEKKPAELLIASAAGTEYTVVRSDTEAGEAVGAAVLLRTVIKNATGCEPEIITDWSKDDEPPAPKELLVGYTNRPESEEVYASLSDTEYAVRVVGEKIVLIGKNQHGTALAVEEFLIKYLGYNPDGESSLAAELRVPEDLDMNGNWRRLYNFTLHNGTVKFYDDTIAATTMQGIFNRESDELLYMQADFNAMPKYWYDIMTTDGRWLEDTEKVSLGSMADLAELCAPYVKTLVVWDTEVASTLNVACTVAGVEDGVVLTADNLAEFRGYFPELPVIDLRDRFDGSVTGSAKNDAYRWAIDEYLAKGKCSLDFIFQYTDGVDRAGGNQSYAMQRDWTVYNRAFVYDLSPWGDEAPRDDLKQPIGCDLETYKMMLAEQLRQTDGKQMTEVAGFFNFGKYSNYGGGRHEAVPTEWETVYLITPYNCFQNTATELCFNQSLHCRYEVPDLKQGRPAAEELDDRLYFCVHMADYDSTYPFYNYLTSKWDDPELGKYPLCWGVNPNLIDTYPDLLEYYYQTKAEGDYFGADASAAGYFNPNYIAEEHWDMVVEHNKRYYEKTDMTISPMVLDWDQPSDLVKDMFKLFSPDGFATIVCDFHGNGGRHPKTQLWNGMPVTTLNNAVAGATPEEWLASLKSSVSSMKSGRPNFIIIRIVWQSPTDVNRFIELFQDEYKRYNPVPVDPYTFFDLLGRSLTE